MVTNVEGDPRAQDKLMRLRYAGRCRVCGLDLPAKSEAFYEPATRTVRCLAHETQVLGPEDDRDGSPIGASDESESVDPGTPGASARREFERRAAKRKARVRTKHPKVGGVILALSDDPQSTRAWDVGALGEERLGNRLNELSSEVLRVLHDRRIPGSRANIDHIVVAPTGIYVIDAKKYKGRPSLKVEGGLLRPRAEKLLVGPRDCTQLVDGVLRQIDLVRGVVGNELAVHGVLCFIDAEWPLIGGSFVTRGVEVLWPKKLYPKLAAHGPLNLGDIATVHQRMAVSLPAN